jgi:uncharacterized membrane protein (DUF4010 family)
VLLLGAGAGLWGRRGGASEYPQLQIRNPFDLGAVLKLAALIAIIMLVAKTIAGRAGAAGLYLVAAVSGVADVDALTISMSRFAGGEVGLSEASFAILIAAGVNTASKAGMSAAVGGRRLGLLVAGVSAAALAAVVITVFAMR